MTESHQKLLVQWFASKKKKVWVVLNLTTQYEAKLCIQGLCIQLSFVERRKQNN